MCRADVPLDALMAYLLPCHWANFLDGLLVEPGPAGQLVRHRLWTAVDG
jgi:hypothetical protein